MAKRMEYIQLSINDIFGSDGCLALSKDAKEKREADKIILMPTNKEDSSEMPLSKESSPVLDKVKTKKAEESKTWKERKESRKKLYGNSASSVKKTKPVKPDILAKSEKLTSMYEICEHFGVKYLFFYVGRSFVNKRWENQYMECIELNSQKSMLKPYRFAPPEISFSFVFHEYNRNGFHLYKTKLLYMEKSGQCWESDLVLKTNGFCHYATDEFKYIEVLIESELKWKPLCKLVERYTTIQSNKELWDILEENNPYACKWLKSDNSLSYLKVHPEILLLSPELELLYKAGFEFVQSVDDFFLGKNRMNASILDMYNRLCKHGRNLSEIFKTSKAVYTVLKHERDLAVWDTYRKMEKTGKLSGDTVRIAYENNYDISQLNQISSILNKMYHGKKIFTWDSLVNYLNRLDTFEAIERDEALVLLRDYLDMCNQLDIQPRVDSDSLKREHDIAARMSRLVRNEKMDKSMQIVCENYKQFYYEDDVYFVRSVTSYNDLIDEANQQRNCVASYAQKIINGGSLIFFLRRLDSPNKSLITIELSPDGKIIRQKLLAHNRKIWNGEQSDCIKRWHNYVKPLVAKYQKEKRMSKK